MVKINMEKLKIAFFFFERILSIVFISNTILFILFGGEFHLKINVRAIDTKTIIQTVKSRLRQ